MRRNVCIAVLAATAVLGVGSLCMNLKYFAAHAQQKPEAAEVKIDNFSFGSATPIVPVGATVTWINRDDIPHTVVSTDDPRAFKSKALDIDDKFSFTFSKPGTFPYFCSLHPKMIAKVVVH